LALTAARQYVANAIRALGHTKVLVMEGAALP
jgi:hypothetical protein